MKYLDPNDPEFTAKALGESIDEQSESEIPEEFRSEFDSLKEFADAVKKSVAEKRADEKLEKERVEEIEQSFPL